MLKIVLAGGDLADPAGVIRPEVQSALAETAALLEREVKVRTPIGVTAAGRGSIAGEVRAGLLYGMGEPVAVIGSPLKHVQVINDGRRPGQKMPPPEALELWVRRKIVYSAKKGPRGGLRKLTVAEARGIAFVIARSIGEKGIEGRQFFEKALQENEAKVRAIFERAGARITLQITNGG